MTKRHLVIELGKVKISVARVGDKDADPAIPKFNRGAIVTE